MAEGLELNGARVLLLGLGRRGGGESAARYLAAVKGAKVTLADSLAEHELVETLARLDDVELDRGLLGVAQDDIDLAPFDLLVRNPAVPHDAPILQRARAAGISIHTEATIFVADFPGRLYGITGTKGKTSTAFFLHHLLGASDNLDVRLAGNMGGPGLDELAGSGPESMAVYEFSSFQTETLGETGLAPAVACLTNLLEDHLDRYADTRQYWEAKAPLFRQQSDAGWRVHAGVGLPDDYVVGAKSRWISSFEDDPGAEGAVWEERGQLVVRLGEVRTELLPMSEVPVEDAHRRENVLSAVGAAIAGGAAIEDLRRRVRDLPIVPHRMEDVPVRSTGRRWINDTAATNPAAAAAGIRSRAQFGSLTVLCGGSPKRLDSTPLISALLDTGAEVVLLPGVESEVIGAALADAGRPCVGPMRTMAAAVQAAAGQRTDAVLLSPGCASFSSGGYVGFQDEFDRGGQFIGSVLELHGIDVPADLLEVLRRPRRPSVDRLLGL